MSKSPLDRREFLVTGAGLAAAAIASPRSVLGANDQRIGIGLVGCRGPRRIPAQRGDGRRTGRIQVVGLCDVWSQAREKLAATVARNCQGRRPVSCPPRGSAQAARARRRHHRVP